MQDESRGASTFIEIRGTSLLTHRIPVGDPYNGFATEQSPRVLEVCASQVQPSVPTSQ